MTSLFIGNLNKGLSKSKLLSVFREIGHCNIDFKTNKGPYAFVEYTYSEDAVLALKKLNNTNLKGVNGSLNARIEISHKKKVKDDTGNQVLVDGTPSDVLVMEFEKQIKNNTHSHYKNNKHLHNKESREQQYTNTSSSRNNNYESNKRDRSRSRSRSISSVGSYNQSRRKRRHEDINEKINPPIHMKNICFVCRLQGHLAKDCILTREMCFECGEKGHLAKECNEKVREAKVLTLNRVKAIRSQQSEYKCISEGNKIDNIIKYIIENEILEN